MYLIYKKTKKLVKLSQKTANLWTSCPLVLNTNFIEKYQ